MEKQYVSCIVAAGGSGSRMGTEENKLFLAICGVPVIVHTLRAIAKSDAIDEIIISARKEDMARLKELIKAYGIRKVRTVVQGGAYRAASVKAALAFVSKEADLVAVHDGARPLILQQDIQKTIVAAAQFGGAAVGVRPKCTLKRADENGFIVETVDRSAMFEIQTPQVFRKELLVQAYQTEESILSCATDDCSLVERLGKPVCVVEGSYENIKVTTPEDIPIAECLLGRMIQEENI